MKNNQILNLLYKLNLSKQQKLEIEIQNILIKIDAINKDITNCEENITSTKIKQLQEKTSFYDKITNSRFSSKLIFIFKEKTKKNEAVQSQWQLKKNRHIDELKKMESQLLILRKQVKTMIVKQEKYLYLMDNLY